MWRDSGIVLLLASVILLIASEQDEKYNRTKNLNITVPRWVENGTEEQVILDCEYDYQENEENIVIKWFLNEDSQAVYQWIPSENSRIFSSLFKGYADWEYQLQPSDKFTKYRRIVLKRPTVEFRGTYQCTVNSVYGHGTAEAQMDIFAIPKNITLTYKSLPDEVNVTCIVEGIFPEPEIQLLAMSEGSDEQKLLSKTTRFIKDNGIHGYYASMNARVSTYQLNSSADTTFICVVSIPDSEYKDERKALYHPELMFEKRNKPSSAPSVVSASFICILFAILVL